MLHLHLVLMKNFVKYILFAILSLFFATSCSVKKNNAFTRSFHYTKVKYNILFNGNNAYDKGIATIHTASVPIDNYNDILPVFEESNQDALSGASGDMDRVIEKCDKSIQLHSIVKKPKKNPKKAKDPKYKAFMAKEEYNSQVQEAWLLKGKAQSLKLDFPAAEATFMYIAGHYKDNKDVCTEAKLWTAKDYTEQGWYYEAEDILNRLTEKDFSNRTTKLYVLVKADLLLRMGEYEAALPFLKNAIDYNKGLVRKRAMFIYAQVLEQTGRYAEAYNAYNDIKKKHPDYIMEFNAVLNMARCYQGTSMEPIKKEIDRLLKRASNEQYKDRIYYTMGKLHWRRGDKDKAMEYYQMAIDGSTRNGIDKAEALLALGDIYYNDERYLDAQPLYAEAVTIIPTTYPDYKGVLTRSTDLDYVAKYSNTVTLQDSLLMLAAMPESERVEKVKGVIEEIHIKEEEERKRLEEEARQQEEREKTANMAAAAGLSLGETLNQAWYFYNATLISRGKLDFQRMWGNRTLEDDWRRSNKVSMGSFEEDEAEEQYAAADGGVETETPFSPTGDAELDSYLATIPVTDVARQASNNAIEEALYNLYYVYDNRIKNKPLAMDTYNELLRRYPNTQYGKPKETVDNKVEEQAEPLYVEAYKAFKAGDLAKVRANAAQAELCCADSKLMPKFLMLEALLSGRQDGEVKFKAKLTDIINKYPDSEIVPLARDMVALVGQGKEIQSVKPVSTINMQREAVIVSQNEYADAIQRAGFEYNPDDTHSFIIVVEGGVEQKNKVLFSLAQYNFTRFMIKDFDFRVKELSDSIYAIGVTPLSSLDEAVWYQNQVLQDEGVKASLQGIAYRAFVISDSNFIKVFDKESMIKYIDFYMDNNLKVNESEVLRKLEEESGYIR